VTHTYASAGTNTVILTVMGTGGTKSLTNTAYIVVTAGGAAGPAALFTNITAATIFVTQSVTFTNTSMGGITNSAWNFGDSGTTNLTLANASNTVTHIYNTSGNYTVQLIVTSPDGSGMNSTTAGYIVVKPKTALGGVTLAGGKLVFSGTNGPAGSQYRILTTTNVALPLAGWTPVWTNVFAADGSYSYTNTPGAGASSFFLLVSP
jgi:PKD repeat protein